MLLSAVEVLCNELLYFLVVVFDVLAQSTVVECLQLVDDTVNHCRAEYSVFLEYLSVFLKAFSRSSTAVWQLLQCCYAVSVFCIVDVIVDISLVCNFKCVFHFETMTASNAETSDKLIYIGGTVWRTHLHSLLERSVVIGSYIERISFMTHVHI